MTNRGMVVVGGSIAAATAASTFRSAGWQGPVTVIAAESVPPYSRVPLSKGILAGTQDPSSSALASLPTDVELRLSTTAVALHPGLHSVELSDGEFVGYAGLVIATGSRPRRLARPGQLGEYVVRTLYDAAAIAARMPGVQSAIVVGAGFLGMEIATTLVQRGITVTVVDRDPPLERVLGEWLARRLVQHAVEAGVRFVNSPDGVELIGRPVHGIRHSPDSEIHADLVITAAGDIPNVEWLESSGLRIAGGVVVDRHCRVTNDITAAGDVTVVESAPGSFHRTPHWSNAVAQGRAAALSLLDPRAAPTCSDHYFWTEQFGIDLKIAGRLPVASHPIVLDGDLDKNTALLQWRDSEGETIASAAWNYRIPVARLRSL
ncbi:NAD(P)/FAD-dependent oxidoreductase [Herbiconiux liukaitaii]|uniref:NAD(P)/FAD-dependent oxidoreductase n=1 Tax=Herbiconiux liukaitaii TaxID=3342799 RepID=UPI0035BA05FF